MSGLNRLTGSLAIFTESDVDTDRIMPAKHLQRVERQGYGERLFDQSRGADFPLDQPEAKDASFLLVGPNFGCGSSREHAVWGLQQAGFKALVSCRADGKPGYADIFRQNSMNCGLLLIEVSADQHQALEALGQGAILSLNLEAQTISSGELTISFEISPATKAQILSGHDLVGMTTELGSQIASFEERWNSFAPAIQAGSQA